MLLQTVEGELLLVVDVDLERLCRDVSWHYQLQFLCRARGERAERRVVTCTHVLHELFAGGANLLGERGREHHDLLLVRSGAENVLDVAAHV